MKKPILAALAILLFGTIVLPGCFYAGPGPWWWDEDHDEGWRHHEGYERRGYERHGAVTPRHEDANRHDNARHGHDDGDVG